MRLGSQWTLLGYSTRHVLAEVACEHSDPNTNCFLYMKRSNKEFIRKQWGTTLLWGCSQRCVPTLWEVRPVSSILLSQNTIQGNKLKPINKLQSSLIPWVSFWIGGSLGLKEVYTIYTNVQDEVLIFFGGEVLI